MEYRQYKRVPRHWNSYRPAYDYQRHVASSAAPPPPPLDHENPNHVPLPAPNLQPDSMSPYTSLEHLPIIWDPSLDSLMGRTLRAYELVCSYEHDSMGGKRWLSHDIEQIRVTGQYLFDEITSLRKWRSTVVTVGNSDGAMMMKIENDACRVRELCEKIQDLIQTFEQIPSKHSYQAEVDDQGHMVGMQIKGAAGNTGRSDGMEYGTYDNYEHSVAGGRTDCASLSARSRSPLLRSRFSRRERNT